MGPKGLILEILSGKEKNLKGVLNPVSATTIKQMEIMDSFFPEAHYDAKKMFELSRANRELLGYDGIMPIFSVVIEASALGCEIDWGDPSMMPRVSNKLWDDYKDIQIKDDFLSDNAVVAVLDCISMLKDRYPDIAIIGKVFGPWTLSYEVFGVSDFLMKTVEEPQEVRDILKKLSEVTLSFADAQVEAGADLITLADHATRDLCSPESYRDFLIPIHSMLAKNIKAPTMLHICGDTSDRIRYITQTGLTAFHFESKVDACEAVNLAEKKIKLIGNVNNPSTLLFKRPADVAEEVVYAIDCGVDIIGPECAVPLTTPIENLKQIATSVKDYNKRVTSKA